MNIDFTFICDHLEGLMALLSFILSSVIFYQMREDKKEAAHEKRIEIYMNLSSEWHDIWTTITSFPEKNQDLFKLNVGDLKDENYKCAFANAVFLLSRVFYYYEQTNQDITKSDWHRTCKSVFNKNIFFSVFSNHKDRYSPSFNEYVNSIKKEVKKVKPANENN